MIKSFKDMQVWKVSMIEGKINGINLFYRRNHTNYYTKSLLFFNLNLNTQF